VLSRYLVVLILISFGRLSAQGCDSHRVQVGDSSVDLAPPRGFVDVCGLDSALCRLLTAGYPPSVKTLSYFVPPAEWDAVKKDSTAGFHHYLIAQWAVSMQPEQLQGFKTYLRAQQGNIPDHTELPRVLAAQGRVSLGIVAETATSISFGTILTARPVADPNAAPISLVATNTAAVVKSRMLSLYVYQDYRNDSDVNMAKSVTSSWLQCIGNAN
jgi:hypothetical protein